MAAAYFRGPRAATAVATDFAVNPNSRSPWSRSVRQYVIDFRIAPTGLVWMVTVP